MDKPLIILGAGGQVGRQLATQAARQGVAARAHGRQEADITSAGAVAKAIDGAGFVVNCAAYTAVDKAESERDAAYAVNAEAPALIAQACAARGIPVLHISTDYVFGETQGRPWREDDPVDPPNVYGLSKEAGEAAVRAANPRHLILRTAWVYDSEGSNFVRTMLRLGATRDELRVVGDQHGGPTAAEDIALAILAMIAKASTPGFADWGTYHFTGAPETTWFDFAAAIFAGRATPKLTRITTADYPTPAKRPAYSVLDCGKIAHVFGIAQPDWRVSLAKVLQACAIERSA
jgi:dTDP-4-dehydrorhamnose reductase